MRPTSSPYSGGYHKGTEFLSQQAWDLAAGGTIWDPELKKMAHYRDRIKHPNATIRNRWIKSGENEFGRLFQGFKPNNIEGMDVLEWIPHTDMPADKFDIQ